MIKSNILDIEATISKLDTYSDFHDEGNIDTFRLLVEEFGSWGHPLTIQYLLRYLDDQSDYPEVLFDIVHVIESYTDIVYIQRLLPLIPALLEQAPEWTRLLHYRIFNNPHSLNTYKERLQFTREECKDVIKNLLTTIKSEDDDFAVPCDLLLYAIRKEDMKRLIKPVDSEALTAELEQTFANGFRKIILQHMGDKPCGLGVVFDHQKCCLNVAINTADHTQTDPHNKWCIEHWRNHETLDTMNNTLAFQNHQQGTGLTADQRAFYISECSVSALENLSDQGFFPRECNFIYTLKQPQSKAQQIEWIERLNTQDDAAQFKHWLTTH